MNDNENIQKKTKNNNTVKITRGKFNLEFNADKFDPNTLTDISSVNIQKDDTKNDKIVVTEVAEVLNSNDINIDEKSSNDTPQKSSKKVIFIFILFFFIGFITCIILDALIYKGSFINDFVNILVEKLFK